MSLEDGDLNMYVSFGLIAYGRLGDILKIRESLKRLLENEYNDSRIVYSTITARKLWIVKKREDLENERKG